MMVSVTDINCLARQSTQHVTVNLRNQWHQLISTFMIINGHTYTFGTFHYNKTKTRTLVNKGVKLLLENLQPIRY